MKNIFAIGVLLLIAVLGGVLVSSDGIPTTSIRCPDCNVIIIGVDTLRADRVHAFGYERETTPAIDALVEKGYAFTNAIAPSSWTVPSFMSIMTGVYPSLHKVINKYVVFDPKDTSRQIFSNVGELSPDIMTLAQVMKSAGYATGGFTGDAGVGHMFGYSQGFDEYTDEKTFGNLKNSMGHALSWLDGLPKEQKFFMFFHGYDLHGQSVISKEEGLFVPQDYKGPYTGTPQDEARLRELQLSGPLSFTKEDVAFWNGLYDSKIRAADAQIAVFLNELEKRGLLEKTVIVLTSDHGEEYFEHGGIDHGHTLYNEQLHVPLIVRIPGTEGGVFIPAQVSTMDIGPALVQILGVSAPSPYREQTKGRPNLVDYLRSPNKDGYTVFSETDYRDFTHKRSVMTTDGWKYIVTLEKNQEELYDTSADPGESKNLITDAAHMDTAENMRGILRNHLEMTLKADPSKTYTVGCLPVYKGECE